MKKELGIVGLTVAATAAVGFAGKKAYDVFTKKKYAKVTSEKETEENEKESNITK